MNITFDPTTAGTATVLVFLLESLTLGFLWHGVRKYAGVTTYIIGALLQAIGYSTLVSHHFIADGTQQSLLILNFIATTFVMAGYTAAAWGIGRFFNITFSRRLVVLVTIGYISFIMIYAVYSFLLDSEKLRVIFNSFYIFVIASLVVWWVFRKTPHNLRLTGWTMGYIHIIFSLYTLLRALNSIFPWHIPWVDAKDVSVQLYAYVGIASFMMYLSFLLLVGQRLLNSSQRAKSFNESILANLPLGIQVMDARQLLKSNQSMPNNHNNPNNPKNTQSNPNSLRRNQALRSLLTSMDVETQNYLETLIGEEANHHLKQILPRAVKHGEYDIATEDGTMFTIQSRTFDIQGSFDETTHVVTILEDISEKKRYQRKLEQLVSQDALTGVMNRRSFEERLRHEWQRALRHNFPLSLAVIDLDKFKRVNDSYGHKVGDNVLCQAADIMQHMGRKEDTFARYGGEEFVLLLPHADAEKALQLCERMRQAMQHYPWQQLGLNFQQTVSMGVAEAAHAVDTSNLFQQADKALYYAKNNGRNQVVLANHVAVHVPQFTEMRPSH